MARLHNWLLKYLAPKSFETEKFENGHKHSKMLKTSKNVGKVQNCFPQPPSRRSMPPQPPWPPHACRRRGRSCCRGGRHSCCHGRRSQV